ncbi:MAG: M48 family metallopeptidase [Planctomycetes bacterium]|nr:M48 family metallopeptidase [Planctomycetota bacterium]
MPRLLRALFAGLLAMLPAACNISSDDELEPLRLQAYEEATKETKGIVDSGRDYEMVQRVAKKIAAASGETKFPWEARLLRADDIPNAFCLPNGRIAIYTGILPITQNEDGLAIVMGHEVAHAILRHGGKRMTQGTITQAGMSAVQAGLGIVQMGDEAKAGVMAALGMGAQVGVLLPFSREHESEADLEGLRYAIRAGYDPDQAPPLWERMAKLGSGDTPSWLSTHPDPLERAKKLREMIPILREQEKNWQPPAAPAPTPPPAGTAPTPGGGTGPIKKAPAPTGK